MHGRRACRYAGGEGGAWRELGPRPVPGRQQVPLPGWDGTAGGRALSRAVTRLQHTLRWVTVTAAVMCAVAIPPSRARSRLRETDPTAMSTRKKSHASLPYYTYLLSMCSLTYLKGHFMPLQKKINQSIYSFIKHCKITVNVGRTTL